MLLRAMKWSALVVLLAMVMSVSVVAAQDDLTPAPLQSGEGLEAPVVVDVADGDVVISPDTEDVPGDEADPNTQEIVALVKDVGMWAVFIVLLFLMRNSIPPSVYRDLLQERRERAAQTPTNLDDMAVEVADLVLSRLLPQTTNVKASTTTFDESAMRGG